MKTGQAGDPTRDVVVCADILGSFGVTPTDVRSQRREYRTAVPPGRAGGETSLRSILEDVLADARDRTAMMHGTICRSDRGLTCSARYAQTALARQLDAVFEAIGWSFECTRTGPTATGRDRLELAATDPRGRRRETTFAYPDTPLADDNLPAAVFAVNERLLEGTDATFVLLSAGVDRWRAALVETGELEALRDRYGRRVSAFDRPLLPEHALGAYVPEGDASSDGMSADDASGPWPSWALERAERRSDGPGVTRRDGGSKRAAVASLIDEAEPETSADAAIGTTDRTVDGSGTALEPQKPATSTGSEDSITSAPSTEADGFEIRGGSPSVSRVRNDGNASDGSGGRGSDGPSHDAELERNRDDAPDADFGTLSGPKKTARIGNDTFGTGDEFETENDRYRALGAALGAGGAITVDGLLEDDEFIPEIPAAEPVEARIEFADEFDPAAVSAAKTSAEQSGFEWVGSGDLETTRLSNG
ncbi:hypothetical protein [Natronorubrum halophilum]|uniref:hypothetical protein n=1 Tax=Natronorubrum halophilum TaxID=1702106 RepID=UPI0010C17E09|nr:hypothetical protein [Natronorubrum halophilum]